jgi:signal transduction histidine kinase
VSSIGLSEIAELGSRTIASSADAIAAVTELVQRLLGVHLTALSEIADGDYVFRGVGKRPPLTIEAGAVIPYASSLCSRIHLGEAPNTIADTREVPAMWSHWLGLKQGLGVDWDILAFCTRDVRLPDGSLFGTLCVHHLEPREWSADEQALLEVLATFVGQELWRERSAGELDEALAALRAAEQRRVELAEELRHELRAPLQVIDGYAEAMLDAVVARDEEHLALVRSEAGRAIQLLDDLAQLARVEARVEVDPPEDVAVDEAVLEMRDRLAPLAESAGVELVAEVEPAIVSIPRKRLDQLLVNLVRNALRAVQQGAGTRVAMSSRTAGDRVEIGVEDDGPGIARDELARVFDRFYRGRSGRDGGSGSGLGLTIARRIVEAAGGEIAAEPVEPHGVRVVARLPQQLARGGEAAPEP